MDEEALAAEDCVSAGPRSEASPAVVGVLGGSVDQVEATVFAGENGSEGGPVGILWNGVDSPLLKTRKRLD